MITFELFFVFCASLFGLYGHNANAQGTSHMVLEESYTCKDIPEQKMKANVHPKDFNPSYQLVDINMTVPANMDNQALLKGTLDFNLYSANKVPWVYLITIEGELCKTIERYMGDFWYDVQTAMGIMRRSCPFPRGSYHAINHHFDFQKLKIQSFPLGYTRVRLEIKTKEEILLCITYVASNVRRT